MPDTTLPGARRLQLAGVGFDRSQQVVDGLVRCIGAYLNAGRVCVDQRERRIRSTGQLGQPLPMQHADLDGRQADRVAVGSGRGNRRVTDDAVATGAVDDVDRLSQLFFEQRSDDASSGIGAAACAPRHDQGDRTCGIGLRKNRRRDREGGQASDCAAIPTSNERRVRMNMVVS